MRTVLTAAIAVVLLFSSLPAEAAGPATGLTITPSSATLTADQGQTFVVRTTHGDGTTTDVTGAATLSMNDPLGVMSGATYTAGKAGAWTVQASYQSFNATAPITVTAGALAELDINPNSDPEYTTVEKTRIFTAAGFDQDKNPVSVSDVSWSVIGNIGLISAAGVFRPTEVGTGKVQAKSGDITGQVSVVVNEPPVENAVNTNTANQTNTNTAAVNTSAGSTNTNTANVNSADNSNANVPTVVISSDKTKTGLQCTTLNSWLWILLLVVFLGAVFFLYWLAPATKFWPVIVALIGAGGLTFVQRKYGCDIHSWWAWAMIIGTVALSLVALRQSTPKKTLPPV